jgi:hypothetical protein
MSGGTEGGQVQVGPVTLGDGSLGLEGSFPLFGAVGVAGSADFKPYSTTFCGGPSVGMESLNADASIQACINIPYGYQNAVDSAADAAAPVLAPLLDPSTYMDPFNLFMDGP